MMMETEIMKVAAAWEKGRQSVLSVCATPLSPSASGYLTETLAAKIMNPFTNKDKVTFSPKA